MDAGHHLGMKFHQFLIFFSVCRKVWWSPSDMVGIKTLIPIGRLCNHGHYFHSPLTSWVKCLSYTLTKNQICHFIIEIPRRHCCRFDICIRIQNHKECRNEYTQLIVENAGYVICSHTKQFVVCLDYFNYVEKNLPPSFQHH